MVIQKTDLVSTPVRVVELNLENSHSSIEEGSQSLSAHPSRPPLPFPQVWYCLSMSVGFTGFLDMLKKIYDTVPFFGDFQGTTILSEILGELLSKKFKLKEVSMILIRYIRSTIL